MYKALSNLACDCFILDIYNLIFCAHNAYVSEGIQTNYTIYALLCNSFVSVQENCHGVNSEGRI